MSYHLEIWHSGKHCASVDGDDWARVYADAQHYAFVYGQDNPTEIRGIPLAKLDWLKSSLSGKSEKE